MAAKPPPRPDDDATARDERLRHALAQAPDADQQAPPEVDQAILKAAREAARPRPAPPKPAPTPAAATPRRRPRPSAWRRFLDQLFSPVGTAALATVALVTVVGVMWRGNQPLDGGDPFADSERTRELQQRDDQAQLADAASTQSDQRERAAAATPRTPPAETDAAPASERLAKAAPAPSPPPPPPAPGAERPGLQALQAARRGDPVRAREGPGDRHRDNVATARSRSGETHATSVIAAEQAAQSVQAGQRAARGVVDAPQQVAVNEARERQRQSTRPAGSADGDVHAEDDRAPVEPVAAAPAAQGEDALAELSRPNARAEAASPTAADSLASDPAAARNMTGVEFGRTRAFAAPSASTRNIYDNLPPADSPLAPGHDALRSESASSAAARAWGRWQWLEAEHGWQTLPSPPEPVAAAGLQLRTPSGEALGKVWFDGDGVVWQPAGRGSDTWRMDLTPDEATDLRNALLPLATPLR